MFLTVLIATVGRAKSLHETLESIFVPTNLTERDWEMLVVVNSASDGDSIRLCQEFEGRYPDRFRFLIQPQPGKSRALNMGLAQARGQLVAMTDDDVTCAPEYVGAVAEVFRRYPADVVQGRVLMNWIGGRPEWLSPRQATELSLWDFGDQVIPFPQDLSGCNMVVRADVARGVGGFATELGPGASGLNEDTEFSKRLRKAGYRQIYAPQVLVHHRMPSARTTPAMLRKRSLVRGRSTAYYEPPPERLARLTQWYARQCLLRELRALWLTLGGRRSQALELQCQSREIIGFFWQHWLFRMGRRPRRLTYELAKSTASDAGSTLGETGTPVRATPLG
jgi:glucosyl-dolichyl phosphate glucuronosyltransferase